MPVCHVLVRREYLTPRTAPKIQLCVPTSLTVQHTNSIEMANIGIALLAAVAAAAVVSGSAQQIPPCASKLIGCAQYLNSTSPPVSCCGPLKEAVKTEAPCLCGLFNDTSLLKTFNIDLKQVLQLPKACGITESRTTLCSNVSATAPPTSPTGPTPASSSPPATPAGGKSNSAYGTASIGFPVFTGLLLFLWSMTA